MRRSALLRSCALAVVPVASLALTPIGIAGAQVQAVTVDGVVSCDTATGHQIVTWTLTNNLANPVVIDSADVLNPEQNPIDLTVTLSPNPVAAGATATGSGAVPGASSGDLNLFVNYTEQNVSEGDNAADGEVVLPGGCVAAPTTTTTTTTTSTIATTTTTLATSTTSSPSTTTAVPATAAAAVVAAPKFTG